MLPIKTRFISRKVGKSESGKVSFFSWNAFRKAFQNFPIFSESGKSERTPKIFGKCNGLSTMPSIFALSLKLDCLT